MLSRVSRRSLERNSTTRQLKDLVEFLLYDLPCGSSCKLGVHLPDLLLLPTESSRRVVEFLSKLLLETLESISNLGRSINISSHTAVLCSSGNGKQGVDNVHLSFQLEKIIGGEDGCLRDSEFSSPG